MVDNIDLGKTHEYFKWVAKKYGGAGRVKGRPRFVMWVEWAEVIGLTTLAGKLMMTFVC
jgi:hypothetical protein